jgi:hypothetical protein
MSEETVELVRYRMGAVTIDGAPLAIGQEAAFRILGDVGPAEIVAGVPTFSFRVRDWAGPWTESEGPDAPVIPDRAIAAAAAAIESAAHEADPEATEAELSRVFARAAMEGVARLVWPTHDEAASLALSVGRLDVEKLRGVGDQLAALLAARARDDGDPNAATTMALWRGVAHGDWAGHDARRRAADGTAP